MSSNNTASDPDCMDDNDKIEYNATSYRQQVANALCLDQPSELLFALEQCAEITREELINESSPPDEDEGKPARLGKIDTAFRQELSRFDTIRHLKTLALVVASKFGALKIVTSLLEDKYIHPDYGNQKAIHFACEEGHLEIAKLFLDDSRVDKPALCKIAVRMAANNGHCDVVQLLLKDENVNPGLDLEFALAMTCLAGDTSAVRQLLERSNVDRNAGNSSALLNACAYGRTHVVNLLLKDGRLQPSQPCFNKALNQASQSGHVEIVRMLARDKQLTKGLNRDFAFRFHCGAGDTPFVKAMLDGAQIDPSAGDNAAMQSASFHGRTDVVKLLLSDPRVDPAAMNNYGLTGGNVAVKKASERGHESVVKLLLSDKRVDPSADGNKALLSAIFHGHSAVVALLLSDPRVDPCVKNGLTLASERGQTDIVKMLLVDSRMDEPTEVNLMNRLNTQPPRIHLEGNSALQRACSRGKLSVVKLLLADTRINPLGDCDAAMNAACKAGQTDVLKILLADPRVDSSITKDTLPILTACLHGRADSLQVLLRHPKAEITVTHLSRSQHKRVIEMFILEKPYEVSELSVDRRFEGATTVVRKELNRWEARSAFVLLLAVKRTQSLQTAGRLSDVLREVSEYFSRFHSSSRKWQFS